MPSRRTRWRPGPGLRALVSSLLLGAVPASARGGPVVGVLDPRGGAGAFAAFHAGLEASLGGAGATLVRSVDGRDASADLWVAVGSKGAGLLPDGTPAVACMVMSSDVDGLPPATPALRLDFSVADELDLLVEVLPQARRLGILYDPEQNAERVEEMVRLAEARGLEIQTWEVGRPSQLPGALGALENRVDAVWGLPDTVVFTPQTARSVLLHSFRQRIPVVGLSPAWVKSGALASLDWDQADLGAQCGELALAALDGSAALPPLSSPRSVRYVLNRRTADQMKLTLSRALLSGASRVH